MPCKQDPDEYIRTHIKHDTYTYDDCYNHRKLMEHLLQDSMRRGYQKHTKDQEQLLVDFQIILRTLGV